MGRYGSWWAQWDSDSRLRGNDGGGAGMTVGALTLRQAQGERVAGVTPSLALPHQGGGILVVGVTGVGGGIAALDSSLRSE